MNIEISFEALFIPLAGVLLCAFWAFDTLVKKLYHQYPEEWESAGRPRGFFWSHDFRGFFSITSYLAMQKLAIVWLFKTPEWVKREESSFRRLSFFRKAVIIWNVGFLAWVAIMIFFVHDT